MSTTPPTVRVCDANEAVASVAHRLTDVIAIYPITPSSAMGEHADEWSAAGQRNLWGTVPTVVEMQSEAGAAGAVHGALQAGALATSFTASQGLLLMVPNLYKIAGELTPFVLHVSARAVATHALSIFGDHSDVMACRQTGFALLCAGTVQEAHDFAAVAHAVTLRTRVPFLHFFDGFRTSHEVQRILWLTDDDLNALIDPALIAAHRARGLSPDHPVVRGTAQNPDVFFQAREASNPFHLACPDLVQVAFDQLARRSGRSYRLFEYEGDPAAERVIVMMGSGATAAGEAVQWAMARGERVGVLQVRLYRPFDVRRFVQALPATVKAIAVLDRTKEPGAVGEPLRLDVVAALYEAQAEGWTLGPELPNVIGGRYGLAGKEFTPAMALAVFAELARQRPRRHFTIGIDDDVTRLSLDWDRTLDIEADDVVRCVFYGLGADGTVGANKRSVHIVGEQTERHVQGWFVYDSKKSGAVTVSHLRFSPRPIRSSYLVARAQFVACHQFPLLARLDVVGHAAPGATLLVNAPVAADTVWERLPADVQHTIQVRGLRLWCIDAARVAREVGLPGRVNVVMQAAFFALADVLPRERALACLREATAHAYARKGPAVVAMNLAAIESALAHLAPVTVPLALTRDVARALGLPASAPAFVQRVTARMLAGHGDELPVSAFAPDGTWPVGTSRWEKRAIALDVPVWEPGLCIQCNKCAFVCPHAAIRVKVVPPAALASVAAAGLVDMAWQGPDLAGQRYVLQVAPDDCTGCGLCVDVCPGHAKDEPARRSLQMEPLAPRRAAEQARWAAFLDLPDPDRARIKPDVKGSQLFAPLFEFPGACAGCGETPYLKLLSQLFGERAVIANATGCSSIFGGNLPTTPWTTNADGRGPAWANSLFEDNAEFGLGMRLALDQLRAEAEGLLVRLAPQLDPGLVGALHAAEGDDEGAIQARRAHVGDLMRHLRELDGPDAMRLHALAAHLMRRTVWIVGGDGWAYDIGSGGLDHVLALGADIKVLVLDTEVYSNTGGQQSKATPLGAQARFASHGKDRPKKDLGLLAMAVGGAYVARIAFGAKDAQTVKAMREAEHYPGPALVIAYSHCIAHGYDLRRGLDQQRLAVQTGYWPLFRFDPRRKLAGQSPLQLDSPPPRGSVGESMANEGRFQAILRQDPARYAELVAAADRAVQERDALYRRLAGA